MKNAIVHLSCLFLLVFPFTAQGSVRIDLVKEGTRKIPIYTQGLSAEGPTGPLFQSTLAGDILRSGWFTIAERAENASLVLRGRVSRSGNTLSTDIHVDGIGARSMHLIRIRNSAGDAAELAHEVADSLVEAIIGKPGIASTRIAVIGGTAGSKELYVCGADGKGLRALTADRTVSLAPRWGPDRETLTYTSYTTGYPDAYQLTLLPDGRARRVAIARYPGINMGAHLSPDGKWLAIILSKDGNPDLYVKNMASERLRRLTRTRFAAEASPCWSPDGRDIVYVADGSRRPQLFIVSGAGGTPRQITFDRVHGTENVSPNWGPDGRIVYSSRRGGFYQLYVYDPASGEHSALTNASAQHEEPSWAANGRHIVYAKKEGVVSRIFILDTMGDPERVLFSSSGNWHSPAWSR